MEEALALRWMRMQGGILYGFMAGMAYGLVMGSIDAMLYRDLPIAIEWGRSILTGGALGFALAIVGALTNWHSERFMGIGLGALATSIGGLGVQLSVAGVGATGILMLALMSLPVAVLSLPIAILLRWLAEQYTRIRVEGTRPWKKAAGLLLLICGSLALGMLAGYFEHMPAREVASVRAVDATLKIAKSEPQQAKNLPLTSLPGLKEHIGTPYKLSSTPSKISTVGYDVRVLFEDGFSIICETVAYTSEPYVRTCSPGTDTGAGN